MRPPVQEISGTNYVIVRKLGEGGHATVYLCDHKVLPNRSAAIKVLQHTFAGPHDKIELAARMRVEGQILAQLHHKNLVKVEDAGITTGDPPLPYIVMEYLRGEPLSNTLATSPHGLSLTKALDICLQLVAGLAEAHKLGVVHRDIKPANIFVSRQPDDTNLVKLLDFGVACLLAAKRSTGNLFLGTPKYASPEQCAGHPVTPQSDLYAVGLIAYELVCGRGPFSHLSAADFHAHFHSHLTAVPPRPITFRPNCPPDLEALILQLLEKSPARRPATAPLLHDALTAILGRVETNSAASLSLLDRTEPDPLNEQLIPYSARTPTTPLRLPAATHDTKPDLPMGNRVTVRMRPATPAVGPLVAHLPRSEPFQPTWEPAMAKRTIRMPSAPPRPSTAPIPSDAATASSRTVASHPEPSSPRSQEDSPLSASLLPAPVATRHSSPPPPPAAVTPQVLVALQDPAEPSAPPALVLQAQGLRRVAHSRPWQLGAGATVLLLLLVTLWTATRQPRFVPPEPPAWLTAQPIPAPASSIPSAAPDSSATAATIARDAFPDAQDTSSPQPTAALPSPAPRPATSPPSRPRPAPYPAAPPSEFKTVFH